MNDFSSMHEHYCFLALGKVPEVKDVPFRTVDQEKHIIDLTRIDHDNQNLPAMAQRFHRTFSGLFKIKEDHRQYERKRQG